MKGQWQIARQRDYRGGEVQALLPEAVGRNQLLRMENALIFPNGYVTAFFQTNTKLIENATTGICLSLNTNGSYTFYATPTAGTILTGNLDTSLNIAINVNSGTSHAVTNANISSVSLAVTFLNKFYCPNSTAGVLNLTDFALISIPGKNIKRLYVYTNRLWGVCTDGTLIISDNGDATTWNPLNVILLPNSEPIIDFIPIQGGAIVYSQTSIYAMYGSSYTDITFTLLLDRQRLSSGAINIDGTVYILGTRGVYKANLNGANEIPHNQAVYFQSNFSILAKPSFASDVVQGIYLERFQAIMWSWDASFGGTQSVVYYPFTNSYSKVNQLLNHNYPHILALNDANTDFLIGGSVAGDINKSTYPSRSTLSPRISTIQTRYEDADSLRSKVWRELSIQTSEASFGVTIDAYLDDNTVPINICTNQTLVPGYNLFFLDIPRSKSISFNITVDNSLVNYLTDTQQIQLTGNGSPLFVTQSPGQFTFEEFRLKYREAGAIT